VTTEVVGRYLYEGYNRATRFRPLSFVGPSSVAGLIAWFKADTLSLNDGDAIGTWPDSSANGNDATQGTAANKPTYKTNILNSKAIVRFDGTNDYLTTPTFTALAQPNTVIGVVKSTAPSTNDVFWDGTSSGHRNLSWNAAGDQWYAFAGSTLGYGAILTSGSFFIVAVTYNGASSKMWKGGGAAVVGNANTNDIAQFRLGGDTTPSQFLAGDEAEIILYNAAVSLTDLNNLGSYLATKWGLTWTTAT
jgi:hypothetical protein